jgi:putative ABC transport system permease protein
MGALVSDFRTALRALAARPAFTAVAVLTLALGIGANSAIFSVVHAVLLRPLPYRDAERLVWITAEVPQIHLEMVGGADYLEWRDASRLLASVAAWDDSARFNLKGGEQPERLQAARVSAGFLSTLGVQPALGRSFAPDEEKLNGGRPAIVTRRLWDRLFGVGTALHEQSLRLDDEVWTVVGVLPEGFLFPRNADIDLLVPLALDEAVERSRQRMSILQVVGRLKPGVTPAQVRAELKTIQDRAIAAAQEAMSSAPGPGGPGGPGGGPGPGGPGPGGPGGGGGRQMMIRMAGPPGSGPGPSPRLPQPILQVTALRERLVGDVRPALLLMLGAVGLVLLIACANVANLLLARATARRQEIAVRAALGAGRGQIVRLLLAESAALGLLGGVCGLLLAVAAIRPLVAMMPAGLAAGLFRQTAIGVDGSVLAFTLLLSVGSALLFGLAPALTAARRDLQNPLKEGAKSGTGAARGLLVVAEMAVAVVLLVGAGLLLHSFLRLLAVDPGFDPERVLTLRVELDPQRYPGSEAQSAYFQDLSRRLRALPGVAAVTWGDSLPLTDFTMIVRGLQAEGRPPIEPEQQPEVAVTSVGPDYFSTLGIRLVRGRGFTERDAAGAAPVAVISQSMARKFWGGEDPVGRRLRRGRQRDWATVIGVAADVKHEGLEAASPRVQMYQPFLQEPRPFSFFAVRTRSDPAALARSVRAEVLAFDRNVPVYDLSTLRERLADSVADRRFNLTLLGLFALLALALAGVGLYGVLAYAVAERTHEIGIRMALGAERRRVLALILRQGLTLAGAGIAIGLPVSLLLGGVLRSSLFGITAADPAVLTIIPASLLAVALLAAWLPARRATRVEPIVALRER